MNIEVIQSQFQAVVSKFVSDRDKAVANINKLIQSDGDTVDELIKQMEALTLAKMNIANTQEEVGKIIQSYQAAQKKASEERVPQGNVDPNSVSQNVQKIVGGEGVPNSIDNKTEE